MFVCSGSSRWGRRHGAGANRIDGRIMPLPAPEAALRVLALLRAELGALVAPHGAALAAVTELATACRG
jgi:hypothetical protein